MEPLFTAAAVLAIGGVCLIIASLLSDPEEDEEGEWPGADGSWPE